MNVSLRSEYELAELNQLQRFFCSVVPGKLWVWGEGARENIPIFFRVDPSWGHTSDIG